MGKLYDLVKLRNTLLDKIDSFNLEPGIQSNITVLNMIINTNANTNNINLLENFKNDFNRLILENQKIIDNINNTINTINQDIDNHALELLDDTYKERFSEKRIHQTLYPVPKIIDWVTAKITHYSDLHYPALQINPRTKILIDQMVAGDPLYLTHSNIKVVKDIIKEYPELYQNRLRLYEIIDRDFSKLPQAQFGFVLCWDNFNYLSLDKIEKYIKEVWQLLRPGGKFIFSYNNCDIEGSVHKAEHLVDSYASARHLTNFCIKIGYEIIALHDMETGDALHTHISWVEIKKPGNLHTVKLNQSMGKILSK